MRRRDSKGRFMAVCAWPGWQLCQNPSLWWLEQFICPRPYQPRTKH